MRPELQSEIRSLSAGPIDKSARALVVFVAVGFGLTGCFSLPDIGKSGSQKTKFSSKEYGVAASPRLTTASKTRKGGGRYSLGKPYKVRGRWYTPKNQPNYDKTGTSSWYGPNFHGRETANGEVFDMNMPSAAHTTLPLPSYVRVTNLANGRHMVVRVNDRGPYVHGRVIDLSKRAAELLDFKDKGVAKVRVQYLRRAPLEGDDTAFLVATLNKKSNERGKNTALASVSLDNLLPVSSPKPVLRPETASTREFGPAGGRFGAGSFSYAPQGMVSDAHEAIGRAMLDTGALAEWTATMDADKRSVDILLGTFGVRENASELVHKFAHLAAVDLVPISGNAQKLTQVRVRYLKAGVGIADIQALARANGLNLAD